MDGVVTGPTQKCTQFYLDELAFDMTEAGQISGVAKFGTTNLSLPSVVLLLGGFFGNAVVAGFDRPHTDKSKALSDLPAPLNSTW